MAKPDKWIWLGVGLLGTYLIVTKTQILGDITKFVKMHTGMSSNAMATKMMDVPAAAPSPFDFPKPPASAPTPSPEPNQVPSQHTPPDMTKKKQQDLMEQMRRASQMNMRTQNVVAPSPFQQTQPEIGNVTREPPRQPQITGPITPEPQRQPQIGPIMPNMPQGKVNVKRGGSMQQPSRGSQPRRGMSFNINTPYSDSGKHTDQYGCFDTESEIGNSCRTQGQALPSGGMYYDGNFVFPTRGDGQKGTGENRKIEITAGGPGSSNGLCCGITTTLGKDRSGKTYFQISTEDWRDPNNKQRGQTLCEKGSCMGQTVALPDNINSQTMFSWHAQRNMNGTYTYCGKLNDQSSGCLDASGNPLPNLLGYVQSDIKPGVFQSNSDAKQANDPTRCRSDGFTSSACMGMFTVS